MEFRVLGPLELHAPDRRDLGPAKQRLVLSALLVNAGTLMPTGSLIDRVWGEDPPPQARDALYPHLARIRRLLRDAVGDAAAVRRERDGYRLELDPETVDLFRFRRLVRDARAADDGDRDRRATTLRQALALWRGVPLDGLEGPWVDRVRAVLGRERIDAALLWSQAERDLAHPATALPLLEELADEHLLYIHHIILLQLCMENCLSINICNRWLML